MNVVYLSFFSDHYQIKGMTSGTLLIAWYPRVVWLVLYESYIKQFAKREFYILRYQVGTIMDRKLTGLGFT